MTVRSAWRSVRIKEVADRVTVGYVGSQSIRFVDQGVPLLRGQNIKPGAFDLTNLKYISDRTHEKWSKSALSSGDVVIIRVGYPGVAAVVPPKTGPLNAASLVIVRPDHSELNSHFLAYLLNSPWGKTATGARLVGAAQQVLNTNSVADLEIRLPPITEQRQIAGILRTFDLLIENNRRRVELLEQMAEAIYREWFVHFRYPGHEAVPMVDSPLGPIPEDWGITRIGKVLEFKYGRALKAAERKDGDVPVIGSAKIIGWHDKALVQGPAIVVGRKGNVGNVIWVPTACWPIDTTYYVQSALPLEYVYEQLRRADFMNSHAAVPGLSREQGYGLPFLVPSRELLTRFAASIRVLRGQSEVLRKQADNLRMIRDLLLPKLVTGQIDVSDLDLDALVGSAT